MQLKCIKCTFTVPDSINILTCPHHSKYYSYLEVYDENNNKISLYGEGNTAINFLPFYSSASRKVYVKDETSNPSGSVKDREMAGIFQYAISQNIKEVCVVSAGNGAISAAYFAAKAGITLHCFLLKKTSRDIVEYISQAGAIIHLENGDYEDIFKKIIDTNPYYNVTPGINPFAEVGTKFIGHELIKQIPNIAAVVIPMGNGTQLAGIWKGFAESAIEQLPKMIGVEIIGCDPIYQAYKNGADFVELDRIPQTKANGIAARCAFTSPKAVRALKESKGEIVRITEYELDNAIRYIKDNSSIVCGSTSAAVFAALGKVDINGNIVCLLSGKN